MRMDGAGGPSGDQSEGPGPLINALARALELRDGSEPLDGPAKVALRIIRLLEAQGIDGEALLRFGMGYSVAGPALGAVIVATVVDRESTLGESHIDIPGWREALGQPDVVDDASAVSRWLRRSTERLQAWVLAAPLDELLQLTPPTRERLSALPAPSDSDERVGELYEWLYKRTVGHPLDKWSPSELHLEYRWQDGQLEAPGPESLMSAATVDDSRLCRLIAHHAVYSSQDAEESQWLALLYRMQDQAKSFLHQRRYVEAAALFEYLLTQRPGDAHAANNLGFCLIPVDAERSASCFVEARRAGFRPLTLLLYNQICSATNEDQLGDLLHTADRHWVSTLEPEPVRALIWIEDGAGSWVEQDSDDVRQNLAELAVTVSERLGRFDRAAVWRERSDSVRSIAQ